MINHPNRSKRAAALSTGAKLAAATAPKPDADRDYSELLSSVHTWFNRSIAGASYLFTTNVDRDAMWNAYLSGMPVKDRQFHNCNCCRRFIQAYGGLVTIDEHGTTRSVMNPVAEAGFTIPKFYAKSFRAMNELVSAAVVDGLFVSRDTTWGTPLTAPWEHLAVVPPAVLLHNSRSLEPNQVAAAARENTDLVIRAMAAYSPAVLDEALRVLNTGLLGRSEKFIGPVQWLRDLHNWPKGRAFQELRGNLLWRAVAAAPEGFCHIRSSVVAPLLDDIVAGVPFDAIKRKHEAKVDARIYQRPQAAPTAGNIAAAEKLVEKMGIAPSLNRRFARIEDLELKWIPADAYLSTAARKPSLGVFSHLKPKGDRRRPAPPSVNLPPIVMTWEKFERTVLQNARQIDALVGLSDGFYALTTAVYPAAPPIIKWDTENERNPVSWYTYVNLTHATQWKLRAGWTRVTAITPPPNLWGTTPSPHLGQGMMLILDGAVDTLNNSAALFPEHMKEDLHAVRSTIEAFSRKGKLAGAEHASACGVRISPAGHERKLRVHDGKGWMYYTIDRWD